MKKVILVDGNNLLFRSYYATAYSGTIMKNSSGFPTNALYGLSNMLNKIITEEKPEYIIVALDKGKTFRHEKYKEYKAGRKEMPDDLKIQFKMVYELLDAMGITYLECDNYEADDIIGTIAKMIDNNDEFVGTIISSDKDLLQLISKDIDVKLLKQKDYIRLNLESFREMYGFEPIKIIDLKALQGDASDNIPGVKGIGEKTAIKLLQEYGSLDNIYNNLDNIKGSVHEKLKSDKENAYYSKDLATICTNAPINIALNDIKYRELDIDKLSKIYNELEFFSLLKNLNKEETKKEEIDIKIIKDLKELKIDSNIVVDVVLSNENYHTADILGISIMSENNNCYIPMEILDSDKTILQNTIISAYDIKKIYVAFKRHNILFKGFDFDLMIALYLLNYNVKDDIITVANIFNYEIPLINKKEIMTLEKYASISLKKSKFIFEIKNEILDKLKNENLLQLFLDVELPLASTLARMELEGIRIDRKVLNSQKEDLKIKIELIEKDIYNMAGLTFNISSPKQLGEVLFNTLNLPCGKKTKTGYSTDVNVLLKLKDKHPIIDKILEYRSLTKLLSTYIEGINNLIMEDGKIHTIYTQTLTRTGRLSSIEPNLQNIPIRTETGKLIRKFFIPESDSLIMSSDYSQIELRILAHMANVKELIDAFKNGEDIHTKTAMEIFGVPSDLVTKEMRRQAKAVNFGIIYGISSFGYQKT